MCLCYMFYNALFSLFNIFPIDVCFKICQIVESFLFYIKESETQGNWTGKLLAKESQLVKGSGESEKDL